MNSSLNETFVCLIPKKERANRVKDFKPISLVTGVYKIMVEVLADRLKRVILSTISSSQGAFILSRKILD